jgi:Mg2+-importing ATPase
MNLARALRDADLPAISRLEPAQACEQAGSTANGLTRLEAEARLETFGPNVVSRERKATVLQELWGRLRNPLNGLLLTLAVVSWFLGDVRAAVVIVAMVVLAVATAFVQEHRSNEAAARLRAMVHTRASVRRTPGAPDDPFEEVALECLVPGDVVRLSASRTTTVPHRPSASAGRGRIASGGPGCRL